MLQEGKGKGSNVRNQQRQKDGRITGEIFQNREDSTEVELHAGQSSHKSPLQAQGAEMEIQNPFLKERLGFPSPLQLEAPQQLEIRPVFM